MSRIHVSAGLAATVVTLVTLGALPARGTIPHLNGFEAVGDAAEWTSGVPSTANGTITRVPSGGGVLGYTSASGGFHAEITNAPDDYQPGYGTAVYTRSGGSVATYAGDFFVSLDIYVDTAAWLPTGDGFWIDTSPRNIGNFSDFNAEVNFRVTVPTAGSVQVEAYSLAGSGTVATLTSSGWYTFVITFRKTGNLTTDPVASDQLIYNSAHLLMGSQTLSTLMASSDLGGNSYEQWFTVWRNGFANDRLAIDNERTGFLPFGPSVLVVDDDGMASGTDCDAATPCFSTISAAVAAANAGDTIKVCPGTYVENVSVNKQLTLLGAQSGVDARGRVGAESIITPAIAANTALELTTGSGATVIDGFTLSGGTALAQLRSVASAVNNNLAIRNNRFVGFTGEAIFLDKPGSDVTIDQNLVDCTSKTSSGGAVHLDTDAFHGFHLTNNDILGGVTGPGWFVDGARNVGPSANRNPLISGNKFNNNDVGANVGRRSLQSATIIDNEFKDNDFDGLQGGPLDSTITRNTFSGNDRWGVALTAFGTMTAGFGAINCQITENAFFGNTGMPASGDVLFSTSQPDANNATHTLFDNSLGSAVGVSYSGAQLIQASGNWWGTASNPEFSGHLAGTSAANIDYTPWLDVATDTSGAAGFQGSFSVLNVDDDSPQVGAVGRVQEGVNLVTASTVNVLPGLYEEQVVISMNNLQLLGSGDGTNPAVDSIIRSPVSLTYFFNTGANNNYPVIGVHNCTGVTVDNLRVDGFGRGNMNYRFIGIAYYNAGGTVSDAHITGIRNTPLDGLQHGNGVYAFNNTGGPYTLNVTGTDVNDYQKNGLTLSGVGLTANVNGCTATGAGPTTITAQNGIQVGFGAGGTITGCTITGHIYTPGTFAATGIIPLLTAASVDVVNCSLTDNSPGLYYYIANGDISDTTVTNAAATSGDGMYAVNDGSAPAATRRPERLLYASPIWEDSDGGIAGGGIDMTVNVTGGSFAGHDATNSAGIYAYSEAMRVDMNVTGCTVRDWDYGLYNQEVAPGIASITANSNCIYSNVSFGYYTDAAAVQDATDNYWGTGDGPADPLGTVETDGTDCALKPVTTIKNAVGVLGNAVTNDLVVYCPWSIGCGDNQLILEIADPCVGVGENLLTVVLYMRNLNQNATGYNAFLAFDDTQLNYRGDLSSYPPGPFPLHVQNIMTAQVGGSPPGIGWLNVDGSSLFNSPGTNIDSPLATLVFEVGTWPDCTTTQVTFRPPPTMTIGNELSFNGVPLVTVPIDSPSVTHDATAPSISGSGIGGAVDANCEFTATFTATVSDNCCLNAAEVSASIDLPSMNATLGPPSISITQINGTTVGISASVLVSDLTGCPAVVRLTANALDCCGNSAMTFQTSVNVTDNAPPVVSGASVIGGNVDGNCERAVTFSASLIDNCCITVADVPDPVVSLTTGNATLGTPVINKVQFAPNQVNVSGSVLVSDLTSCPATVQVTFSGQDCCDNAAAPVMASGNVQDVSAPLVSCANVTTPANAGLCTAAVTLNASATDNCATIPGSAISFTIDTNNNGIDGGDPVVVGSGSVFVFATGMTLVRASATDDCNNTGTCDFTVTVNPVNVVHVTVELEGVHCIGGIGNAPVNLTRCIKFTVKNGATCGPTFNVPVAFTGSPATGVGTFNAPCGVWTSVCAKDEQHTLYNTVGLMVSGTDYVSSATAVLEGGDTDNDSDVDINDVTYFLFRFATLATVGGCPPSFPAQRDADFSDSGAVGSEDYLYLSSNWLHFSSCPCMLPLRGPHGGELAPALAAALDARLLPAEIAETVDLNLDGRVDYADVELFEAKFGLPDSLSAAMRASPATETASPAADAASPAVRAVEKLAP